MQKEVVLLLLLIPFVSAQYYDPNIGQNIAFCNEGDTQCDGNVFLQCVNGNWQAIEQCGYGCDPYQGCTEPAYVPPGVMQIPEEPYEEPPQARPAECYYGEKRCDRQNFQMCINGVWQTQQTCGKYQECTERGCASATCEDKCENSMDECVKYANGLSSMSDRVNAKLVCGKTYGKCLEACGVIPPEAMPVVVPTPVLNVESIEVEPLKIDERKMTSKPREEYVPGDESKPELTCRGLCEKSYDACIKDAGKLWSISDRMIAKQNCYDGYMVKCVDDCEKPPPEAMLVLPPEKPKPAGFFAGVIEFMKGILLSILPGEKSGPRENGLAIDITRWFEKMSPGPEITIDPVGGILLVYWLDEDGRICHGEPGISGQPGAVSIVDSDAIEILTGMYSKGKTMGKWELDLYQKNSHYDFSGYDGTGSHLMHFEPRLWRIRSDEKIIKGGASISLPADLTLTEKKIKPISFKPYTDYKKDSSCVYRMSHEGLSAMPPPPRRGQDPDKCKVKSKLNAKKIIDACLDDRLDGDFSEGYLEIVLPSAVVGLSK